MPRMINAGALWKLVRAGHPTARLRATRDGNAAIRVHLCAAATETGLLDALATGDATTAELARRLGAVDEDLLVAFLRVAASVGLVSGGEGRPPWRLTARGRSIVDDDLVRAGYEGFSGLHTAIYRDMASMLAGGQRRRDMADNGALIARLSKGFEPLVMGALIRAVAERRPRRVLHIGCGAGVELAAMLQAAPGAHGVGVDLDSTAADLAERTLRERGLSGRSTVVRSDIREPTARETGPLSEPFDLALLANVIYYLPMAERVPLLRDIAGLLAPGGVLLLVSTVATRQFFSRHFDLLLRSQVGQMEITDADRLAGQLSEAGFRVEPPRPIAPGAPAVTVIATLPG
jgi:predicted O-methyltransferase YrrM